MPDLRGQYPNLRNATWVEGFWGKGPINHGIICISSSKSQIYPITGTLSDQIARDCHHVQQIFRPNIQRFSCTSVVIPFLLLVCRVFSNSIYVSAISEGNSLRAGSSFKAISKTFLVSGPKDSSSLNFMPLGDRIGEKTVPGK